MQCIVIIITVELSPAIGDTIGRWDIQLPERILIRCPCFQNNIGMVSMQYIIFKRTGISFVDLITVNTRLDM